MEITQLSARTVSQLKQGMNACLLYDDTDAAIRAVAPYVAAGLADGERCIYVLGEQQPQQLLDGLTAAGVDVALQLSRGALVLVSQWDVSFPRGEFDPPTMIAYVRSAIYGALADGFAGLRVCAEMTWALQMGVGHNKLIHYEALGARLYPHEPLVAVCLYDRKRFPAEVCHDALRTHPLVALEDDQVYPNLYYELPDSIIDGAPAAAKLDWFLHKLRRARQAEEEHFQLLQARAEQARAQEAILARDEFLAVAAHELRTPLTSLRGYAQLVRRRLARGGEVDSQTMESAIKVMDEQIGRLDLLVGRLLDLTGIHAGKLVLSPVPCDLSALARDVADRMLVGAPQGRIEVMAPPGVEVTADPLRLEQVLANLLSNALRYSPPGEAVEVAVAPSGPAQARLSVRDRGPGIAPEQRDRIFERYYQAGSSNGGMGLGLHVSREIVRLHGGDITAEFPPDGGACFVVALPATPREHPGSATHPATPSRAAKPLLER